LPTVAQSENLVHRTQQFGHPFQASYSETAAAFHSVILNHISHFHLKKNYQPKDAMEPALVTVTMTAFGQEGPKLLAAVEVLVKVQYHIQWLIVYQCDL